MEVVLDTYQQIVHANATITATGSSVVAMNFGHKETSLVINVTAAPTGTTPTITYSIQEVDPGNGTTTITAAKTGAAITAVGVQILTLPVTYGGDIIVSWVVTGTTPSFTGVYATLVNKGPSPAIYDQAGNGPVAVKAASTAVAAGDPSMAVGLSPNSPLPAGSNALGSVSVTGTTTISGTTTANQGTANTLANAWPMEITDGTHGPAAVKAASTTPAATDPALVVSLGPNSAIQPSQNGSGTIAALNATLVVPAGNAVEMAVTGTWVGTLTIQATNGDGTWATLPTLSSATSSFVTSITVNSVLQANAAGYIQVRLIATAWTSGTATISWSATTGPRIVLAYSPSAALLNATAEISDGTNGPVAVKAASTAAVAADPALVTAFSPNSPLPAGTNAIGTVTVTQATPSNLQAEVGGLAATGAVPVGNPVLVAGSDGTDVRTMATDTSGRHIAVGAAATGAAVAGNPVLVGGSDGTDARTLATDTSGHPIIVGDGVAGTPAGGVVSVQGVSGGTAVPVSGTFTATVADVTASGALGALNAAVTITHPGLASVGMQLAAGTLIGTIVPETSYDGGTTWNASYFSNPGTAELLGNLTFGTANGASAQIIVSPGGAGETRVRVSAYTSGTANVTVRASNINNNPIPLYAGTRGLPPPPITVQIGGFDGTDLQDISTDTSGRTIVIGAAAAGAAVAGNPVLSGGSDGTDARTMLTDTSGRQVIVGAAADGAAFAGNPVLIGGQDGTDAQAILTDTSGRQEIVGAAATGAAVAGNPVLVGGSDGTDARTLLTDTSGRQEIVGAAAAGAAVAGNPVLLGGSDGTDAQTLRTNPVNSVQSLQIQNAENLRGTYSAFATFTAAATPTDVFTIIGSATKTVRVTRIEITATQTTAANVQFALIKRSAANTGGTAAAATAVPYDSNNAAATAVVDSYTANPTALGAAVGTLRSQKVFVPGVATINPPTVWEFGVRNEQPIVLRGVAQVLAFNLGGTTVTGNSFTINIEWTEDAT